MDFLDDITFVGIALTIIAALGSYLLGAVPIGLLVGRVFGGVDVRDSGSGRTGATNVLRTLGWKATVPVVLLDLFKGSVAVIMSGFIADTPGEVAGAVAVVVGHSRSIFIGFGGGRGVIPAGGAALALVWPAAIIGTIVGILIIALTRYVSLGSLLGTVTCVGIMVAFAVLGLAPPFLEVVPFVVGPLALVGGAIIIYAHRDNIQRLIRGTERRFGQPADS
ncbi:MAG: glycerol-3-phosphate 1-O-acyltransferase PlsY [Dehalococcoidia bacterium]|nr:glycerol-3-phosphate 1-O-acyltransferase PlsY [Dehalococcoidia bacterium]